MMRKGTVYLVGAGPGDPKLITRRGWELIGMADVIVYDRLVSQRLLDSARPSAEIIFAGKSPGNHALSQQDICWLLISKATAGADIVVRLKGGDPFVFGRGGEEAEALQAAGIPFEVVPGVTSAVAAPAYAGIPVTHRDYASSLAIITGNEDPDKEDSSIAWDKIATGADTLVFLMGMANLGEIARQLMAHGRPPETPAALIRWGTKPEQQVLVGTLADINAKALEKGMTNPAVIIVGEVVSLREKLSWFENKPLSGKRILVTRAREQASLLSEKITALGGEPLEFPTIMLEDPEDWSLVDRCIEELERYNWVIFTSVNGVEYFFRRLRHQGRDIRALHRAHLCAIGPKTREALEGYGLLVEYVPTEYRAEEIAAGLRGKITPGERVLLPRAREARKVLPEMLRKMGAHVEDVAVYRTVPVTDKGETLKNMIHRGEIDLVTFTSSSTVRNFMHLIGEHSFGTLEKRPVTACIGPITADTARRLNLPVDIQAEVYTIDGLIEAIINHIK